jgi:glycosyltransferase involved in cell wall biosynthesis
MNKIKLLIDHETLNLGAGIARDAQTMIDELVKIFEITYQPSSKLDSLNPKFARRIRAFVQLLSGNKIRTKFCGEKVFYQNQVSTLIPNKKVEFWIVRLHDIFPITNPEWFTLIGASLFKFRLKKAIDSKAIFITNSNSTKQELQSMYPNVNSCLVFPCRVRKIEEELCNKCSSCNYLSSNKIEKYVLTVGTVEPRKNYAQLIKYWNLRNETQTKLVVVGKKGWKCKKEFKKLKLGSPAIVYLEDTCDGALHTLYTEAIVYLSISLDEGFNLPAMEARNLYDLPLVLSKVNAHIEFHKNYAFFINSPEELIEFDFISLQKTKQVHFQIESELKTELMKFIN